MINEDDIRGQLPQDKFMFIMKNADKVDGLNVAAILVKGDLSWPNSLC